MPGRAKACVTAGEVEGAVAGVPSSKKQLYSTPAPLRVVAVYCTGVPTVCGVPAGSGSSVNGGRAVIAQVKVTVALTVPSETVSATLEYPRVVGVPVMAPVAGFTLSPAGKPMAVNDSASASASEAVACRSTAAPTGDDWLPGLFKVGGVFTKVTGACRHCMPTLSSQPPARPYSAKAGLPESQRHGPCAVPVAGPTAPRKVPLPVRRPPAVSARHSKSSWFTYWLKLPLMPLMAELTGQVFRKLVVPTLPARPRSTGEPIHSPDWFTRTHSGPTWLT